MLTPISQTTGLLKTSYPDTDVLVDTQQMISEMNGMCNFDENMLCDYMAEKGYCAHFEPDDAINGWILRDIE